MLRRVTLVTREVSEEVMASIIKVRKVNEIRTALAATNN
jgi:hypothetical protein